MSPTVCTAPLSIEERAFVRGGPPLMLTSSRQHLPGQIPDCLLIRTSSFNDVTRRVRARRPGSVRRIIHHAADSPASGS